MKETDVLINNNIEKGNDNSLEQKVHLPEYKKKADVDEAIKSYKDIYAGGNNMLQKLDILIDCFTHRFCLFEKAEGEKASNALYDLVESFFEEYLGQGNKENLDKVFVHLGKLKAENDLIIMNNNEKFLGKLDPNESDRKKKALIMATRTKPGTVMYALKTVNMILKENLDRSISIQKAVNQEAGLDYKNVNTEEYLSKCGFDEEGVDRCIKEKSWEKGAKLFDVIKAEITAYKIKLGIKDPVVKDSDVILDIKDRFVRDTVAASEEKGKAIAKAGMKLDEEKAVRYNYISAKTSGEINTNAEIENWIKNEGKAILDDIGESCTDEIQSDFNRKYNEGVSYEQYIRLHCGASVLSLDRDMKIKQLSKAVAASLLKGKQEKVDVKKIHKMAEKIKTLPSFVQMVSDPDALDKCLTGEGSVGRTAGDIVARTYGVRDDNIATYINSMKELSDNLMSDKGRSKEYKAFHKAVENIADLKGKYDLNNEEELNKLGMLLVDLNANLISSINTYMKGKKNVRSSTDGQKRFNNSLDALSIMRDNVPGIKYQADALEKRINTVRKESMRINLSDYNATRAAKEAPKKAAGK